MADFFSSFFGGGNDVKTQQYTQERDALAGIRQQLISLSGQVPAMVDKRKAMNAQGIATARKEGFQDIGENVYAERGMGRTSIYDSLKNDLAVKLAEAQMEADLQAELGGQELKGRFLNQAAGVNMPTMPDEEISPFSKLLGGVGKIFGGKLEGMDWSKLLNKQQTADTYGEGYAESSPSFISSQNPYGDNYGPSFSEGLTEQFGKGGYGYDI